MNNLIKTSKSEKIPKPMKIKKEKIEEMRTLQPISHYIDDRLELVKQVFGTLKQKTIVNLAPEFIKTKSMDEIQEMCLNELLCISTKRLVSIVNGSKCPTDTESSSDSDVEHTEEHISLEEISSDSEIGDNPSSSAGKKKSKNGAEIKKIPVEKTENNGQISVLELLELQARARAIRSQLAMEPITKIEVNSDDEGDKANGAKAASKDQRKRNSSNCEATSTVRISSAAPITKQSKPNECAQTNEAVAVKATVKPVGRKIKLKRNYRNSKVESKQNSVAASVSDKNKITLELAAKEIKKERLARSPSADVIPIEAEPETLLIADSSDEESDIGAKRASKNLVADIVVVTSTNSNTNPTVGSTSGSNGIAEQIKRKRRSTEIEEGEITESETDKKEDLAESSRESQGAGELPSSKVDNTEASNAAVSVKRTVEITEVLILQPTADKDDYDKTQISLEASKTDDTHSKLASNESDVQITDTPMSVGGESMDITEEITIMSSSEQSNDTGNSNGASNVDENDDVISIGGGDLESEIIEHLEDETQDSTISTANTSKTDDKDKTLQEKVETISLNSSDDEAKNKKTSESWQSRYLKSSKVSKVLATSRLGKRVRDKIKKSKHSNAEAKLERNDAESEKASSTFVSKHEDGSVEQYKELLEISQRSAT